MTVPSPDRPDAPTRLRFEYHRPGALGVGERRPRLSWQVASAPPGYRQDRYETAVTIRGADGRTWTGRQVLDSPEQVLVPWPGPPLVSRDTATVQIRVAGADDGWSGWSAPASIEVGLLEPGDWTARLVEPGWDEIAGTARRPPLFRREFDVPGHVARARLYVTAHGLTEVEINGRRVGEDALLPGWSVYGRRLRYATYDVTEHLQPGANAIGAWTGDGWYRGRIGFEGGSWDVFGSRIGLLAQLEIVTADGQRHTVATDEGWSSALGPILTSSIYDGETYDARLLQPGWSSPGHAGGQWCPVRVADLDTRALAAHDGSFVRCTQELVPQEVLHRPDGRLILDFGQNHTGRVRLRAGGAPGARIVLRHAEVLQDGEICTRPLREAQQTDVLVLGDEPVEWEPRFTVHGYRYVEVTGWTGPLAPGDIVSRVHHSPLERTGWFWCSEPDVEQLHENVVWSMRSNFVDIPTDCPQRDERLGWTGDVLVFGPAGAWLHDDAGMLSDWLRSVAIDQETYGCVPWYSPFVPGNDFWDPRRPGAVWGDVATQLPWLLYERRGDLALLERQYDSARAWVDLVAAHAGPGRIWEGDWQPGDWLDPSAPPDRPHESRTDPALIATAYFARSAAALARTADALGRTEHAASYGRLADEVRGAFVERYVQPDGRLSSDTQTAYALVLVDDLSPRHRGAMSARLAELVEESDATIATGFVGTPIVCDALVLAGRPDLAYRLLLQRRCPSWLYPITMGATTTWERWDSMLPDGTVNPGDMTSFNHYALGAVADWLYRSVAGIAPAEPGFRTIRFAPVVDGPLTSAGARHLTPYGPAEVSWRQEGDGLALRLSVPVGATGVLDLPGLAPRVLGHGTHTVLVPEADRHRRA